MSFTRRTFLSSAAAGAGVAAVAHASLAQAALSDPLPPSLTALKSRAGEARPITAEERRARLEKAVVLMAEHKLDAVVMAGGSSLFYYGGLRWFNSERLFALVLPRRGRPFLVSPAFEEERARERLATGPLGGEADVRTWEEHEDPYRLLAATLRERGVATGRVGIEETMPFVFSDGIGQAAPALTFRSGTPVTAGCRTRKDAHEIALMRLASEVTLEAYEAVYHAVRDGMPQSEFTALVAEAHRRLGFAGGVSVFGVDGGAALPHGSARPQVIREGSLVLIDGGCAVEGYRSDITRTFVVGKPTDKMRHAFEVELRAQTAALKAARPGVEAQAVDAAARQVITEGGYGPGYKYFTHRVGHGIGLDGHEWPYLVQGNTLRLLPGHTFSNEPGIYLRGEFGIRLEDEMVITDDGAELLTPQSPSLEDPFGRRS